MERPWWQPIYDRISADEPFLIRLHASLSDPLDYRWLQKIAANTSISIEKPVKRFALLVLSIKQ